MGTESWRVYLTEWLTVYTSDEVEVLGAGECRDVYSRKYAGRVRSADWRISSAREIRPSPRCLQLRLPNLCGEFKDHNDALELASRLMDGHKDGPCDLVRRGSDEEKELLEYGKKKLPDAG